MEDTVKSFLADIVCTLHPPILTGINRYTIEIKYIDRDNAFVYYGDKHIVYCEQVGQEVVIRRPFAPDTSHVYRINLADPDSQGIIADIFRTN